MKKYLEEILSNKVKNVVGVLTTTIVALLSLSISIIFEFKSSNLFYYVLPIFILILAFIIFEVWRSSKLRTELKSKNIANLLYNFKNNINQSLNKNFELGLVIPVGKNHLKLISHTIQEFSQYKTSDLFLSKESSISGEAASKKKSVVKDFEKEKYVKYQDYFKEKVKSEICIPIIDKFEKVIGVLNIESTEKISDEEFKTILKLFEKKNESFKTVARKAFVYEG